MAAKQSKDINFKLVLLGTTNVGKTCLIERYLYGTFWSNSTPTIGVTLLTLTKPIILTLITPI